ncbi:MAG TPA: hypothetical protein VGG33_09435 [Polyangia bacterium]
MQRRGEGTGALRWRACLLVVAAVFGAAACDDDEPIVRDAAVDVPVVADLPVSRDTPRADPPDTREVGNADVVTDAGVDRAGADDRPRDGALSTDVSDATGDTNPDVADTTPGSDGADTNRGPLTALAISPNDAQLVGGTTRTFVLMATFQDGSTADVTDLATWTSSNPVAAAVAYDPVTPSQTMGVTPGNAVITAALDGKTASQALQVTGGTLLWLSIRVPTGYEQSSVRASASGTFANSMGAEERDLTRFVHWESSDKFTEVSNTPGFAGRVTFTGGPGPVKLRATLGAATAETDVVIASSHGFNVVVSPAAATIAVGTRLRLHGVWVFPSHPSAFPSVWTSSHPSVATFVPPTSSDDGGVIVAKSPGEVVVTARLSALTATGRIKVTNATLTALEITPAGRTIPKSVPLRLKAMGVFSDGTRQDLTEFATWTSSAPTVINIAQHKASVVAESLGLGTATIAASYGGVSASVIHTVGPATLTEVTVSPNVAALPRWSSQRFTARAKFSDGTTEDVSEMATWCTESHCGDNVIEASDLGKFVVEAKLAGLSGRASLEVLELEIESLEVTPATLTLAPGQTHQLKAEATFLDARKRRHTFDVTHDSSWWGFPIEGPIEVENRNLGHAGLVRALAPGVVRLVASFEKFATAEVTVTPASP